MNVLERRTVGSAAQLGLMALAGYFDAHRLSCGFLWPKTDPVADWAVTSFRETSARDVLVEGLNLNCAPGAYGHRFSWLFSTGRAFNDWRYRFELCPGAEGAAA